MNILRKVIHFLSFIVYIIIGIYALVFVSMLFSYKPLIILDDNMDPLYKKGSIIYYKDYQGEKLKIGDPITYKYDNELITNRIISINKDKKEYTLKGDNSKRRYTITNKDIIGINSNVSIMLLGYLIAAINYNLYLSIGIAITIIVLDFIFSNILKEENKKKEIIEEII